MSVSTQVVYEAQIRPVIVEQVDQTKAPGTSAGQRPEPLAGTMGTGKEPKGLGSRIKQFFLGDKMDAEKLKALGEQQLFSEARR